MAKVKINGEAVVITSAATLENLKLVAKYRPEALKLMGGKDNSELLYSVGVVEGSGGMNGNGALFGRASHQGGLAEITMLMPGIDGDKMKEAVADKLGGALMKLNALEAKLPAVIAEIAEEKAQIMEAITVG